VVDVSEVKRPTRVVVVDADNPMEEVRGEFFWREDHERVVAAARDEAYRAGYEDGLSASSSRAMSTTVRVRVLRRPRPVMRALLLFVVLAFFVSLIGGFVR